MKKFTMIEVIIVTLIIALAFIPIYSLIQKGNKTIYQSENNIKASNLCSEGLEWLCNQDYDHLLSLTNGQKLYGMYISTDEKNIKDSFWTLENFKGYIVKTGNYNDFKYSAEFGGENTGSDNGGYHDFKRVGIVEKLTDNKLKLKVIVRWSEMGKKNKYRERTLSYIKCRQSLKN